MKTDPDICVLFPHGKMGKALSQYLHQHSSLTLQHIAPFHLESICGDTLEAHLDFKLEDTIIVDFSSPVVTASLLQVMKRKPLFVVSGTSDVPLDGIDVSNTEGHFVYRANFSTGIKLAEACIEKLQQENKPWELSVVDIHGKHKIDKPSQTAKHLIGLWDGNCDDDIVSLRTGNGISTHIVLIEGDFETISIELTIKDRHAFFSNILADIEALANEWRTLHCE